MFWLIHLAISFKCPRVKGIAVLGDVQQMAPNLSIDVPDKVMVPGNIADAHHNCMFCTATKKPRIIRLYIVCMKYMIKYNHGNFTWYPP